MLNMRCTYNIRKEERELNGNVHRTWTTTRLNSTAKLWVLKKCVKERP